MVGAPVALDQLKMALKIVASLGDGAVNVPVLRAAACTAIEIIEIAQDDIPVDLQQDVAQYAEKLELVQKILTKHTAQTAIWRRVVSRVSNREEINRWKEIIHESFQVFELNELQADIIAQIKPVPPQIPIIRPEELDLRRYLRLILRPEAPTFVPRTFALRAEAAAFEPRKSTLRADAPVFAPHKVTLRAHAPVFVPRRLTPGLRADARIFVPRKLRLRAEAPVFVPLAS
ncbi:hypothetical protein DFH09DRAFT_1278375 [Mycena vulgaris]|nr:hypothetical protein DFH09DRAFT_1278375 [Mycena vulgaris]